VRSRRAAKLLALPTAFNLSAFDLAKCFVFK